MCYTRKLSLLDGESGKLIKKCVKGEEMFYSYLFWLVLENSGKETAIRSSMILMQFNLEIYRVVWLIYTVKSWGDINQIQMMLLMYII